MATRGKGESSVYKRAADGMWVAAIELPRGRDNKRRRKVIVRKSKKDVLAELKKQRDLLGTHGDLATSTTTLGQWARYWLEEIAARTVTPNTVNGYRTAVNQWIVPLIGQLKLDRVTPKHVRDLSLSIMVTPKLKAVRDLPEEEWPEDTEFLSSTYARLIHTALAVCLKAAVNDGKITHNPCDKVTKPPKGTKAMLSLEADDAIKVLRYLSTHKDGALWATYLFTGARRGEILGLTIDRVGDFLDLSWQLQHHTTLTTIPADWEHLKVAEQLYLCRPKSKSGWRRPPLVEPLKSIIERHIGTRKDGFVFLTEDGSPWNPLEATKEWRRVLDAAGIDEPVPLHGLRHTAVDLLYELEVPEHVISEIVGHSSRSVTRSYRTRGDIKRQTAALEALGKLLAIAE